VLSQAVDLSRSATCVYINPIADVEGSVHRFIG
jgi:hypothetical protein